MTESLTLLTRGVEIECRNPVYRPAIESPVRSRPVICPENIVAELPRRWKKSRGCKVRTPGGDFIVSATPQPDKSVRLDGKNIAAVAAALHLKR